MTTAKIIRYSKPHEKPWQPPILFDDYQLPELNPNWLPGEFGEFTNALAVSSETAPSMSVMAVLGVLSTCLAGRVFVNPKPGWNEPINLYTLVALPPANKKSLVIKECCAPLIQWERQKSAELKPLISRRQSEIETEKKIIQQMRVTAAKAKDPLDQRAIIEEISTREANLPEPLFTPVLFSNDATPEALAASLCEQGSRFAVLSDEGGIMDTLAGLYTNGLANIDVVLKGIDGGDVRVTRKSGVFDVNPYLTFLLCVQPKIIQEMGKKAVFAGRGFVERFLYVLPKSNLGSRTHDKPPLSEATRQAYAAKVTALLDLAYHLGQNNQSTHLTLSADAKEEYKTFEQYIESCLKPNGLLRPCLAWGGKLCGFTLRIAGLLHMAEHQDRPTVIGLITMCNAISIAGDLIKHALAAFDLMSLDSETQDVRLLYETLISKRMLRFRRSDLYRVVRNRHLAKKEHLSKALDQLIERNILREHLDHAQAKPTHIYELNPLIFQDEKGPGP